MKIIINKEDAHMELKFYICKHCGNIIAFAENKGVPVSCCGEKMTELVPNTVDAAAEKHVPVMSVEGDTVTVTVGSVEHPMTAEHLIPWICLITDKGNQRKFLKAGEKPVVCFKICEGETPRAALAYCNLHGLWKASV